MLRPHLHRRGARRRALRSARRTDFSSTYRAGTADETTGTARTADMGVSRPRARARRPGPRSRSQPADIDDRDTNPALSAILRTEGIRGAQAPLLTTHGPRHDRRGSRGHAGGATDSAATITGPPAIDRAPGAGSAPGCYLPKSEHRTTPESSKWRRAPGLRVQPLGSVHRGTFPQDHARGSRGWRLVSSR